MSSIRVLSSVGLAVLFLLSGAAATPAQAPGPQTIRETGTLNAKSQVLQNGKYFEVFVLPVEPGFEYEFELRSKDFDAFLWLQPLKGDIDLQRAFRWDDDSGGGKDAYLRVRFTRAGKIAAVATTFLPGETGRYELIVKRTQVAGGAPAQPPAMKPSTQPGAGPAQGGSSDSPEALKRQIDLLDGLIQKAENNARQCDREAAAAVADSKNPRFTHHAAMLAQARAFRDQAQRFRQERGRLQQRLTALLRR